MEGRQPRFNNISPAVTNNNVWLIESDADMFTSPYFVNNGTITKTNSTGTSVLWASPFTNNGTVTVASGTLEIENFAAGSSPITGSYDVATNAVLDLWGSYTLGVFPTITGGGAVNYIGGGSITLQSDYDPEISLEVPPLGPAFQNHGAIIDLTLNGSSLGGSNYVTGAFNWVKRHARRQSHHRPRSDLQHRRLGILEQQHRGHQSRNDLQRLRDHGFQCHVRQRRNLRGRDQLRVLFRSQFHQLRRSIPQSRYLLPDQ